MNKALFLVLLPLWLHAQIVWDKVQHVKLKKDQFFHATFSETGPEGGVVKRVFKLRWTLFVNEGLVTLINYQGFNNQTVLYTRPNLDTFNLKLLPRIAGELRAPYMSIVFKEFDDTNREAYFDIYIKDNDRTNLSIKNSNEETQ